MLAYSYLGDNANLKIRVVLDNDSVLIFGVGHPRWTEIRSAIESGDSELLMLIGDWTENGPDSDVREKCQELGYKWFFGSPDLEGLTDAGLHWGIAHAGSVYGDCFLDGKVYQTWEECWEEIEPVELVDCLGDSDPATPETTGLWQRVKRWLHFWA